MLPLENKTMFLLRGGLGQLLGMVSPGDCFYRWHRQDHAGFWTLPSTYSSVFIDSLGPPAALHGVMYGLKYVSLAGCIIKTSYSVALGPVARYQNTSTKSVFIISNSEQ